MTTATVLQPIPFNTDRSIIFNVDLEEIDLDPSFPYTGFLSVTQHWHHPLEVELWPQPEGMSEPELLSQGFYQTSAVLSGARLYVHHTQVAEFVEAQDLFDHSHPNPEAKTVHYTAPFELRILTPEIFLSFFGNEKPKPSSSKAIHPLLVEPSKQILERVERLDHLRESGFLTEVFRPHEVLRVSLSHLDHTQLPCCLEGEAKSPSRILIFGSEPFFQLNGIETTMDIPCLWNIVKGLQMCFWDFDYFESFGSLDVIYLLCRYFNCTPLSGLASGFDAQLDLMDNWEWSNLPGAEWDVCASLIPEEVRDEVERISQGWKIREKGIEQEVSLEVAPVSESGEVQRYLYLSAQGWEELHSPHPLDLEDLQLLVGVRGHRTTIEYLTDRISMSGLEVEILMDAEARTKGLEPYCLDPKTFEALPGNILIVTRDEGRITGFPKERIEWCLSEVCTRGDLPYYGTRKTTNYCREEVLAAFQGRPQSRLSPSSVQVYHITHRYRYDKPLDACVKSDRPLKELKETLYYLIEIAAIMLEEDLCGPLKYDDLSSESICFLLQEYYDFELCPYQDGAVEIDLYYLWEFDEDVQRTDPEGELELHEKYGRSGVIDCIGMFMRNELECDGSGKVVTENPPALPRRSDQDTHEVESYFQRSCTKLARCSSKADKKIIYPKLTNATLYSILTPENFYRYLKAHDPDECAGLSQFLPSHPISCFLSEAIRDSYGQEGSVVLSKHWIGFDEFPPLMRRYTILLMPWVKRFNKLINAFSGGEDAEVPAYYCLESLAIAIGGPHHAN